MAWEMQTNSWVRMFAYGRCLGQDIVQQRDYHCFVAGTGFPESDEVLAEWTTNWATACLTWLPSDYTLLGTAMGLVTSLDSDPGPPVRAWPFFGLWEELTLEEPDPGLIAGPSLPLQVSARCRKITNGGMSTFYGLPPSSLGGTLDPEPIERRFRGRISWGPLTESMMLSGDRNRLNDTSREGIENALETLIDQEFGESPNLVTMTELSISLIWAGDFRSNTDPAQIWAGQNVEEYSVAQIVGTQDRRTPGT